MLLYKNGLFLLLIVRSKISIDPLSELPLS